MNHRHNRSPHEPTTKQFFLDHIQKEDNGCWIWKLTTNRPGGYGAVWYNNKVCVAHRVSYTLWIGVIPEGMLVCHHCDNPKCVNPEHLFIGNHTDNMRDCKRKHRNVWPVFFGEDHPNAKLTNDDVKSIRASCMSRRLLAARYGVSKSTIKRVRRKTSYAAVE